MTIYINLKELMKQKNISAIKLSKLTGITPENISVIKNWKTKQIRLENIEKFLKHLEATPNDLFKFKK